MPLIIKGDKEIKVVSKKEMKKIITDSNNTIENALATMSDEKAEKRRLTLENKAARENNSRIQSIKDEEILKKAVAEKVEDAVIETVTPITVDMTTESIVVETKNNKKIETTPNFTSMTKKEIDIWADENIGIQLDRRHTKASMIEELQKHL
ncbi:hypothetical protein N9I00_00710 [bacterium]|nr:hypothetical protein [bacterium]